MLHEYPFLRILIPFVLGLLADPDTKPVSIIPLTIIFIFLLLSENIQPSIRWKYKKSIGLLFHVYIFLLGFNCKSFQTKTHLDVQNESVYIIHLLQLDNPGEKYNRYISKVYLKNNTQKIHYFKGYTYLSASLKHIGMGDVVLTTNKPKIIQKLDNPGSFDFAAFANRNNIQFTIFLNNREEFIKLKHQENSFLSLLHLARSWTIKTLQSQLNNPVEAGLTEALLIGYKEDLDEQLQEQYTLTGVSHIIAVSGMHLGLIFAVLTSFFNLIARRKIARYLGFGLILPLLWIFAFISGASASVLRSVMVFSIVLWGNLMLKKSGSMNALFASAFMLLVIKPSYINDIGFQLSYAAVLSILIYEPFIAKWIYLKNKILKLLWSMVSITIAAQILTTPLVLFHFKQFPVLFLITNMVAVPISNLVLLLAILMCFMSMFFLPTAPVAFIIHWCLQMMNGYIYKVAKIPFNSIQLQTTLLFTICFFVAIAFLTQFLRNKNKKSPLPFLSACFLLFLIYQIEQHQLRGTKRLLVLHVKNATCIVHQHGNQGILITNFKHLSNQPYFKKQLKSLGYVLGIVEWKLFTLKDQAAVIELNNQSGGGQSILLSGFTQSTPSIQQLIAERERPIQLIADGSTKLWKIKQWEKQAQEVHLPLHSTPEKGAFILSCEHR